MVKHTLEKKIPTGSITIIGFGRLGKALYAGLGEAGYRIKSVFSKSPHSVPEFVSGMPKQDGQLGDIVFLTAPDDVLVPLSNEIAAEITAFHGKTIIHCSGTLTSDILSFFRDKGAAVASCHPIKAVTGSHDSFQGIYFDVEGDRPAVKILEKLSSAMGANILPVNKEAKPFLHAAAVTAANYLVTLAQTAADTAAAGGMKPDEALKALLPLMQSSLDNLETKSPRKALTGPVARGDVSTIEKHLKILTDFPELLAVYKLLGKETVKLSEAPEELRAAMIKLFRES